MDLLIALAIFAWLLTAARAHRYRRESRAEHEINREAGRRCQRLYGELLRTRDELQRERRRRLSETSWN